MPYDELVPILYFDLKLQMKCDDLLLEEATFLEDEYLYMYIFTILLK